MRVRATLAIGLLLSTALLLLLAPAATAVPPSDGSLMLVTSDAAWNADADFNGVVRVKTGATLTVANATITVETGSQLIVEPGGSLVVDNASLSAATPPSGRTLLELTGRLLIPLPVASSGTVQLVAPAGGNLSGFNISWDGSAEQSIDGAAPNASIGYTNTQSASGSAWLTVDEWNPFATFVLASVVVNDGGGDTVTTAADLDHVGFGLAGAAAWTLGIEGGATFTASTVSGAAVSISGTANATATVVSRSGPVSVTGTGSLDWLGGAFNESLEDHDIDAAPTAALTATGTAWTNGSVDHWERRISQQTLLLPGAGVRFSVTGLGPQDLSRRGVTAPSDARYTLDVGERLVELAHADGTIWREAAMVTNITWETGWGNFSADDMALAWDDTVTVDVPLPSLSVLSLTVSGVSDAETGDWLDVSVSATNSGDVSIRAPLVCTTTNGDDADLDPREPDELLTPGATETIEFQWRVTTESTTALHCGFDPGVATRAGVSLGSIAVPSGEVVWTDPPADDDSVVMTSIIIVLIVTSAFLALMLVNRLNGRGAAEPEATSDEAEVASDEAEAEAEPSDGGDDEPADA